MLNHLHDHATTRDRAGNRRLFYDPYACLLLLYFFNPTVKSLRGIQQASERDKVQRLFGCERVSRGSLSEASRYRWAVELFFRWLKCILGCRHLLANSPAGVTMQVYLASLASLLISLWVGRKPTVRTLEMIQFYFQGWATAEELTAHLDKLQAATK